MKFSFNGRILMKFIYSAGAVAALAMLSSACKPRSFNTLQTTEDFGFAKQFEVTRFANCTDSKGKESGGFDLVWRMYKSGGEPVTPYVLGFAGSAESIDGQKLEFRSVSTIDEPRYIPPAIKPEGSFPVGSYTVYSLQYPDSELKSGWGHQRLNGQNSKITDVTGATFMVPKSQDAGAFSTRYFVRTSDGKTLEFKCQAVSDAVRARLRTYLTPDGSHGYTGDRGPVSLSKQPAQTRPSPAPLTTPSATLDLRPQGRPASYDVQFRHERIYNCGENGAVDVIWRKASAAGAPMSPKEQYVLGVAAKIKDVQTMKEVAFSSVSMDSAPAFHAGSEPAPVSYLRPSFEFTEAEVKGKLSYHTPVTGLIAGRTFASGGTLWIPANGASNVVSVALALGNSLRGPAFQVTADCTPTNDRISNWLTSCVGRESASSCRR
jgi:hypothetical protein